MSESLQAFRIQNYKAFRDTGWIELADLTLFLGYNSNGKSTILKALELVQKCYKQGLVGQEFPPLVTSKGDNASFDEIVFQGNTKESIVFSFRFSILDDYVRDVLIDDFNVQCDNLSVIEYRVYISKVDEKVIVSRIQLLVEAHEIYNCCFISEDEYEVTSMFAKQLPAMFDVCNTFFLKDINYVVNLSKELDIKQVVRHIAYKTMEQLKQFATDLEYILPLRTVPSRQMLIQPDKSMRVGNSGEQVYRILYQAYFSDDTYLKEQVNKWLGVFGYSYAWNELKPNFGEFVLVDNKTGHKVNIVDVGFGISQILPIIVAACNKADGCLMVDSPEAHLHSRVQSELGDLFIEAAKYRKVIIETHSENIILRIKKRIIEENNITKDFAKIYFIHDENDEAVCELIAFDEYGDFVNAPKEFNMFFSDGFQDIMDITKLKAKKLQEENNR